MMLQIWYEGTKPSFHQERSFAISSISPMHFAGDLQQTCHLWGKAFQDSLMYMRLLTCINQVYSLASASARLQCCTHFRWTVDVRAEERMRMSATASSTVIATFWWLSTV